VSGSCSTGWTWLASMSSAWVPGEGRDDVLEDRER
jgi:hypothetical protein